jgi:Zn-dependent protease with chaperone function
MDTADSTGAADGPRVLEKRSLSEALLDFCCWPLYRDSRGTVAEGLLLYLSTLLIELVLGAGTRWLLALVIFSALGGLVSLGPVASVVPWVFAFLPFAFSALAFLPPGDAAAWARRIGARRPDAEEERVLLAAMAELRVLDPGISKPAGWYIFDTPLPAAQAHGTAVLLSSGMLDSDALAAVLAHELGHVHSLDSRLGRALHFLVLWRDPLGPRLGKDGAWRPGPLLVFALAPARLLLRLAGGDFARHLLSAPWGSYRVAREYAADGYAASHGQAVALAVFLAESDAASDGYGRLLSAMTHHPPVPARIERLLPWFDLVPPR